jgi:hypothetical protein
MRPTTATPLIALTLVTLALGACAARTQIPVSDLGQDDDAICRPSGSVGSPGYVACRKDRDVIRSNAENRRDRQQRDLGEYMLNHPEIH